MKAYEYDAKVVYQRSKFREKNSAIKFNNILLQTTGFCDQSIFIKAYVTTFE